jgi:acetyl esterase/lipase
MATDTRATQAPYEVDIEDVEYVRHGDTPLLARIFRPRGRGPFPAVVEAHGGAWCLGTRVNNDPINMPVARGGVVVAALDFRMPPVASYPGSVADVNYGIRWLKANAERFDTRAGWVGAMGTSSGGHLAVLAALKPGDPRYVAIPLPPGAPAVDARVPYVVSLWPVICPLGRYRYMKGRQESGNTRLTPASAIGHQEAYWITEEAMGEGSPALAMERGDRVEMPHILYVQNPRDEIHPRANLDQFVAAYGKAGGRLELHFFEGEAYDALRSHPSAPASIKAVERIVDFIRSHAV